MVVNCELGFDLGEHLRRLLGRRVIAGDSFELLRVFRGAASCRRDLVDNHVGALRMLNKIFVESGIPGQHGGPSTKIDTVTVGRKILAAVVDFEGADFDSITFENHAFLDLVRIQFDAGRSIVFTPDADIDEKSLGQVLHHLLSSFRSPNRQRRVSFPPGPSNPTRQPKIGKPNDVIRMMMGQKNAGNIREGNPKLVQALHSAAAGIENKLLLPNFYERARTESFHTRRGCAAAKKGNPKNILERIGHSESLPMRYCVNG